MNVTDHQKQKNQKKMGAPEMHSDSKVSEVHNGRDLVYIMYKLQNITVVWYTPIVLFSGTENRSNS